MSRVGMCQKGNYELNDVYIRK